MRNPDGILMTRPAPAPPDTHHQHQAKATRAWPLLLIALILGGCSQQPTPASNPVHNRDFMFQINGYHTRNQGGQTIDMYFYYRYNPGLPEDQIFNYIPLRDDAINYMDTVDVTNNPYWETLNAQLCTRLKDDHPIEAISCQMQVKGDLDAGTKYEPGYHSSVETIGDIPPLQIPGPRPTETSS